MYRESADPPGASVVRGIEYERLRNAAVVIVEDDPSTALLYSFMLEEYAGCTVQHFPGPADALGHLERQRCDLLITDVRLPGIDGLELIRRVRDLRPHLPVVVTTAYATIDSAIEAVRLGAAAFVQKPVERTGFLAELDSALAAASPRQPQRSVLAVGAHPDDIEIGVGGTLLRHSSDGDRITILTLSRGRIGGDPSVRAAEAEEAARRIGAELILCDLEDTRIDDRGATVELIEDAIARCHPDVVYTHSVNDVHQDHRSAHRATIVAARRVPSVYCFQSPSSTVGFRPAKFIAVDEHVEGKLDLIAAHSSQATTRSYLEPELVAATARYWGRFAGTEFAEPLEVERERLVEEAPRGR